MNEKKCMNCNAPMHIDYWDTVEELEDGSFFVDAFEAWVCKNRCGYFERVEPLSAKHKNGPPVSF